MSGLAATLTGWSPQLAVVVIGRNEGPRLTRCLQSVQAMDAPEGGVQVVYVDSASRDRSVELAQQAGARVIALSDGPMSAARARNAGWRAVSAPFVFFVDGDCVVEPGFTRRALAEMADPRVSVVWGMLRELHPRSSVYHRYRDVQLRLFGLTQPEDGCEYITGVGLLRRSVLERVGGYEEALTYGEDREIGRQVMAHGWSMQHLAIPMIRHDSDMSRFSQYWRRSFRKGYGRAVLRRHWARRACDLGSVTDPRVALARTSSVGVLVISAAAEPFVSGSGFLGVLLVTLLLILIGREGLQVRNLTGADLGACLMFVLLKQVQMLPIWSGRLAHWHDHRRGRQRGLIEWR